jgi:hypothetical protein
MKNIFNILTFCVLSIALLVSCNKEQNFSTVNGKPQIQKFLPTHVDVDMQTGSSQKDANGNPQLNGEGIPVNCEKAWGVCYLKIVVTTTTVDPVLVSNPFDSLGNDYIRLYFMYNEPEMKATTDIGSNITLDNFTATSLGYSGINQVELRQDISYPTVDLRSSPQPMTINGTQYTCYGYYDIEIREIL